MCDMKRERRADLPSQSSSTRLVYNPGASELRPLQTQHAIGCAGTGVDVYRARWVATRPTRLSKAADSALVRSEGGWEPRKWEGDGLDESVGQKIGE